jgi:F420-non-reducing hydrogenase iron-sulfur subunit
MLENREKENDFEPKIVAFTCNWCSYAGADLAGVSRIQYPPNLRIVRLMCSARLDPIMVAKTLCYGADGVLILACHIGDCHYLTGNHRAVKRAAILKKILSYLGVDPKRVRFDFVSAAEGGRFAQIATEFTDEIRGLGPLKGGYDRRD